MDDGPGFIYPTLGLLFFLLLLLLIVHYVLHRNKRNKIQRWKKSLQLPAHAQVFQQIYREVDGFSLSRLARKKQDSIDYTYGEIEFLPFIALLSMIKPDHDTVFYDLGSGIGKAVIACAMVFPVRKSVGIEILPELYSSACEQIQKLAANPNYTKQVKKIQFIKGDILDADLSEATLIFINATTFFGTTWETICTRLNNLPHLKTVITTSKELPNSNFTLVNRTKLQMSWGVVLAFTHHRKQICTNWLENIE